MKAGGLDMIAVYIFWIHHEEVEGQWTFQGRRNVSEFFHLAQEVGLKAMARIGPWDHGECRNGGHPDWLLQKKIPLRSNNTAYMGYVEKFYAQLSIQLKGMFWKDGGPIVAVQVDNETKDWRYLLALRDLAIQVGMVPPTFTKTGWPSPDKGYPSDYPMLPFFGGYPDTFWGGGMAPHAQSGSYFFGNSPSAAIARKMPVYFEGTAATMANTEAGGEVGGGRRGGRRDSSARSPWSEGAGAAEAGQHGAKGLPMA
jgi:hypothetical protein